MEQQTLRCFVYLFLIIVGGAALWISILYLILGRAHNRIVDLETENIKLKRQPADFRARVETRLMSNEMLLKDITDLLSDL